MHLYTREAPMASKTLTVRVDGEIAARLEKLARATRRSRSFLAAEAIEEYVALQEWQVQAILGGLEQVRLGEGVDLSEVRAAWEARREGPPD